MPTLAGLIGPGERKSIQPMAQWLVPGEYDQLHHFVAAGVWDAAPLEAELLVQADRLVGGDNAVLAIDDTALPKKGNHSVGVAAQYASALGKTAQSPDALASADHNLVQVDKREAAYFVAEEARHKAHSAKAAYEKIIRQRFFGL